MSTLRVQLPFQPHHWQQHVIDRLRRFSVIVAHRRWGKTVLAILLLVSSALTLLRPNGRFAYVAPFRSQAKAVAWDYLKLFARAIPGSVVNETELMVEFPNGSRIRLFGADNPESLRGQYFDGVVLDEVADMKAHVWGQIIRPALSDRKGWAVFIGTPKGVNLFSDTYYRAVADPEWYAESFPASKTGLLDPAELEAARGDMSENEYEQEYECSFEASGDNNLISLSLVRESVKRSPAQEDYLFAPKVMGVDVARYGDDRSSICKRQGLVAFKPRVFRSISNMELAAQVARDIDRWKPNACFIDGGRGEGVIDRLRQLGYDVQEIQFGGRPTNPRYRDRRAEMWDGMKQWLEQGGALPDDEELVHDLVVPFYTHKNAAGKLQLEAKEDIKKRVKRSPDVGDALALTFAEEVAPTWTVGPGGQPIPLTGDDSRKPYDPFGALRS